MWRNLWQDGVGRGVLALGVDDDKILLPEIDSIFWDHDSDGQFLKFLTKAAHARGRCTPSPALSGQLKSKFDSCGYTSRIFILNVGVSPIVHCQRTEAEFRAGQEVFLKIIADRSALSTKKNWVVDPIDNPILSI
ncbi:hypothetical protein AXG93_3890s1060 [Marchantia polymorpha subsp. ruderalis]|uniref:Uncharacterized protein n=1 Tax=Marchantia polymorpha subsp. ruderalis TaxID=1480154 RepID=A0A176WEG8_MARPO|nr:hypothetical protein AXG93_3890s1060 [Marchantia polymorpha subsp. ruderalis]